MRPLESTSYTDKWNNNCTWNSENWIKIVTWNMLSLYRTGACQHFTDIIETQKNLFEF